MKLIHVANKTKLLLDVWKAKANVVVGSRGKVNKVVLLVADHEALHILRAVDDSGLEEGRARCMVAPRMVTHPVVLADESDCSRE